MAPFHCHRAATLQPRCSQLPDGAAGEWGGSLPFTSPHCHILYERSWLREHERYSKALVTDADEPGELQAVE